MKIAVLLYDEMTALDAIGPYEVLARLPGAELRFVAEARGVVRTDTRALGLVADAALEEVSAADVVLVPGGPGDRRAAASPRIRDWLRELDAGSRFTTSVCTGALVLGAAGLLRGRRATTHWASLEELRRFGAEPAGGRFVRDGKLWTAAGVSAGIDMALALAAEIAGDDFARALQLGIEYDPAPPFDAGAPERAPAAMVQLVRRALARA
jgi:transcriptional regulator GlxA family with amidase domain